MAPGYLGFVRAGNLMAQAFDARTRHATGEAFIVAEGVDYTPSRITGRFSFSDVGTAVYAVAASIRATPTIFEENGKRISAVGDSQFFMPQVILSPDGRKVALNAIDSEKKSNFVWMEDLATGTGSRLTFGETSFIDGAWSKDGKSLAYATNEGAIYAQPADGSAPPALFYKGALQAYPSSWSPDGKALALGVSTLPDVDISILSLTGEKKLVPFITGSGWKLSGSFSPDGK